MLWRPNVEKVMAIIDKHKQRMVGREIMDQAGADHRLDSHDLYTTRND
jgi:hypothetical protein